MAAADQSIVDLLKTAVSDAQELIRSELALAKLEVTQEVRRVKVGFAAFAGAAIAAVVALVFLATTVALALVEGLDWPIWAGFGTITVLLIAVAVALTSVGRARLASHEPMPHTVETLKENAKWIRARTS